MDNTIIVGHIKTYRYRNDDTGYSIAVLHTTDNNKVIIVGHFPVLNEELLYEFSGKQSNHQKYGQQFVVESYKVLKETSKDGVIAYLSSSYFTGIGKKTAEKIVSLLKDDVIDKIILDPDCIKDILNPLKRIRLKEELEYHRKNDHIMISLHEYGLSSRIITKLIQHYGSNTLDKINEDPFRLMYEVEGFGFIKASEIASKMGIKKDDPRTIKAAITYVLNTNLFSEGNMFLYHKAIKQETYKLLSIDVEIDKLLEQMVLEKKIIVENEMYFLPSSYNCELNVAKQIKSFMMQSDITVDYEDLYFQLQQIAISKNIDYTKKQQDAIINAISSKVMIITGGPGTGKTTLIDGLLHLYAQFHKFKLDKKTVEDRIALMAPTGRAAKRMKELLDLPTGTIHKYLKYDYLGHPYHNKENKLPHKLIIIDESSMIDVFLANKLLDSIRDDAQIVIVGDEDQLPSVGPGYFFGDLIRSNIIPTVRLNEIHRQAKDSMIIKLSSRINNQDLTINDLVTSNDVIFYNGSSDMIRKVIINQIEGALKQGYSLIDDIQVLIPMYKGELGIDNMNIEIQKKFNENYGSDLFVKYHDKVFYKSDKVIQLVNVPVKNIMNGDIGIVKDIIINDKKEKLLLVSFDGNEVLYDQASFEQLSLAYVVSIHKSQGSEYKIVFLPIVKGYLHMLKKELIYTAVTRAKQYLLVLGDMSLLLYASNQLVIPRQTMLKERLMAQSIQDEIPDVTEDISPYDFM